MPLNPNHPSKTNRCKAKWPQRRVALLDNYGQIAQTKYFRLID